jgi:hypothetical protein
MGEVWIRTVNNSLVRGSMVTEIASTRGSLHEDQGYALKVILDGKAHVLIDDGELRGSLAERLEYARNLEDALLLALDEAGRMEEPAVVEHDPERDRWQVIAGAELGGGVHAGLNAAAGSRA